MKWLRRPLLIIVSLLLVAVLVIGQIGLWLIWRAWPESNGTLAAAGLNEPVEIIRDTWGVPHIYAQNEHDLFFAQGYVHAQDRMWQMEFNRRIGSGTTSEVLGNLTLGIDRFTRTMQLRRVAQRELDLLDADSRAILQAYADGVNGYINSHRGRLGIEFTVLGVDPAPWTPLDTLTWGKTMALNLSWNYFLELVRARMIAGVGADAAQQLMPPYADGPPLDIPADLDGYRWMQQTTTSEINQLSALLRQEYYLQGSNNWVVGGDRTASGKPLLANDTHLGLSMPSIWYLNGLHGGRFNTVGYTFPGVPLVIIGHNEQIAWGVTDLPADVQDLYVEKLDDPVNPSRYEYEGNWYDLTIAQEVIAVRGSTPVTLEVRMTRHGPIMNGTDDGLKQARPLALRWIAYEQSHLFRAVVGVNLAQDWDSFRRALNFWDAPNQHFVYADVAGNIGYQSAGRLPLRAPGHDGLLPVPGWSAATEWRGTVGAESLYSVLNPASDFYVTANNQVAPTDHPYRAAYGEDWINEWFPVTRVSEALGSGSALSLDDMAKLQLDSYSIPAARLLPHLLEIVPEGSLQTEALAILRDWNGHFDRDQIGATIYYAWYNRLQRNTFDDELSGQLASSYKVIGWISLPAMLTVVEQPNSPWFDDRNTPELEARDAIVRRSFVEALALLQREYGDTPAQWTWGRMHRVNLRAQPLGQTGIGPVDSLFNSGFVTADGGDFTPNNSWLNGDPPFEVTGGPAQRFIIDVGDWDRSRAINSSGQSERLLHPHRTDNLGLWANGQYHPMLFSRAAVESHKANLLLLTPQR